MDSEKCKVLLTVINEGSLSKAADALDIPFPEYPAH